MHIAFITYILDPFKGLKEYLSNLSKGFLKPSTRREFAEFPVGLHKTEFIFL